MANNEVIYDCSDDKLERLFDYLIEEKLNEFKSKCQ
jgi:hypothetical protein